MGRRHKHLSSPINKINTAGQDSSSAKNKTVNSLFTSEYLCHNTRRHLPVDFDEFSRDSRFEASISVSSQEAKDSMILVTPSKREDPPGFRYTHNKDDNYNNNSSSSLENRQRSKPRQKHPSTSFSNTKLAQKLLENGLAIHPTKTTEHAVKDPTKQRRHGRKIKRGSSPKRASMSPSRPIQTGQRLSQCEKNHDKKTKVSYKRGTYSTPSSPTRSVQPVRRKSMPNLSHPNPTLQSPLSKQFCVVSPEAFHSFSKPCPLQDSSDSWEFEVDFQVSQPSEAPSAGRRSQGNHVTSFDFDLGFGDLEFNNDFFLWKVGKVSAYEEDETSTTEETESETEKSSFQVNRSPLMVAPLPPRINTKPVKREKQSPGKEAPHRVRWNVGPRGGNRYSFVG